MTVNEQGDVKLTSAPSNAVRDDSDLSDSELDAVSGGSFIGAIGIISATCGGMLGGAIRGAMTSLGVTLPGADQLSKPQLPPNHSY